MQTFSDMAQFKIKPNIHYTLLDDEVVIMGALDEKLYGANAIATEIWSLLESKSITIPMIVKHILKNYDVEEAECLSDITAYIHELVEEKLIVVVE